MYIISNVIYFFNNYVWNVFLMLRDHKTAKKLSPRWDTQFSCLMVGGASGPKVSSPKAWVTVRSRVSMLNAVHFFAFSSTTNIIVKWKNSNISEFQWKNKLLILLFRRSSSWTSFISKCEKTKPFFPPIKCVFFVLQFVGVKNADMTL